NPASDEIIVQLEDNSKVEKIEFFDFSGKIITPNKVELNNSLIRINVSNIIEGIYLLNITTDKEVHKVKVVIER
ncbi:MAG: T9SS type A sorting domain-containing protein, partial [Marinoscillum sp.]